MSLHHSPPLTGTLSLEKLLGLRDPPKAVNRYVSIQRRRKTKRLPGGYEVWIWSGDKGSWGGRNLGRHDLEAAMEITKQFAPIEIKWVGIKKVAKLLRTIRRPETTKTP